MRRIDGIHGNINADPDLAERIERHEGAGTLERVVLDSAERKRSRLRVETDAGTDLGILVDRPELRAGDVLFFDDNLAIVVALEPREAFVIELPDPTTETLAAVAELGHRIGNQHWDLAVADGEVYVPVEADRHIIENVIGDYLPPRAATRYETVDAELFADVDGSSTHSKGQSSYHNTQDGSHDHSHEDR